jgi:curli biogenesis system outer membrane secretion channel CsgG
MNKTLKTTIPLLSLLLFSGCVSTENLGVSSLMKDENKIDVAEFPHRINTRVSIPPTCKSQFEEALPKVAIVKFKNNTTYGKATISFKDKKQGAEIGLLGTSIGAKAEKKEYNEQREVDAKLSESVTSPLENLILETGAAELITREDMDKIDAELKLQDSGLLDSDSIVDFGKQSGVKYLITGSIDSVEESYRDNDGASKDDNNAAKVVGLLGRVITSLTDGLSITTKVTVKMIDVETGKLVFTKKIKGEKFVGKLKRASFDQVTGAIKATIIESLPQISPQFNAKFSVKSYVTQIRAEEKGSDDIIAQINLGSKNRVQENQYFKVYKYEAYADPLSGKESCDLIEIPIELKATNQIGPNRAWTTVDGESDQLKIGHLIKRTIKE